MMPPGFPQVWKITKRKEYKCPLPFNCHICNRQFARKDHLEGHIEAHNLGSLRYKCKICGMAFLQFDTFARKHVTDHILFKLSRNSLIELPGEMKGMKFDKKMLDSPRFTMSFLEENTENLRKQNELKKSVNSLYHLLKKAQDAKNVIRKRDPPKSTIVSVKTEIKIEAPEE